MNFLQKVTCRAIEPSMAMLPRNMDTCEARVLILTIGLQETGFINRRQLGDGPAKSFWQMEEGGGVKGVLHHSASQNLAERLCMIRGVPATPHDVWNAIEFDDVLAAGFARLLLWTDTHKLPATDDAKSGWEYYLRTWNPGKPRPDAWPAYHAQARLQVAEG